MGLEEIEAFNQIRLEKNTLWTKIKNFLQGVHYKGVEAWRIRHDFDYGRKAGYDNLRIALENHPITGINNVEYFEFLLGKL